MQIALCDDQEIISKELSVLIKKFNQENQFQNDMVYFAKPSKLYEYMQVSPIELIFMDLEFSDASEDGIEWSKKILKNFHIPS